MECWGEATANAESDREKRNSSGATVWYSRDVIKLVEQRRKSIAELCRRHDVRRLELFGSAARGDFQPDKSDLDFVVQFARTGYAGYADAFLDFAEALEKLFGRNVDLLTERMIRSPHFRAAVDATRQVVYEDRGQTKAA